MSCMPHTEQEQEQQTTATRTQKQQQQQQQKKTIHHSPQKDHLRFKPPYQKIPATATLTTKAPQILQSKHRQTMQASSPAVAGICGASAGRPRGRGRSPRRLARAWTS